MAKKKTEQTDNKEVEKKDNELTLSRPAEQTNAPAREPVTYEASPGIFITNY